ncbi:tetratricopeptide repeat domain containing protein [Theileria equi strain WA]|uniref:E3 ubiquitin-protein ligase CHIP n=1 Tax=Theileria equi strain WA TaxID=1537102 RepID=L0AZ56_THEEQ|nr:tetratricopeptide repeat domain containing protein [Theileria equi strain WA]AFZ80296.1 tetratricopeptide repeat domain containing protein [Theileria equi strain WA]|eukprot:XP_004829962.1 tetratricopeptide repeat domain containing protein [Theileria equi strain WA]
MMSDDHPADSQSPSRLDIFSHPSPSQDSWEAKQERIKRAEELRVLGNESFKLGYLESAINYYTRAIELNPDNHEYYTNRALCYKRQQKWEMVESDVRQALNLEENSVKAHYLLGQALVHLGNTNEGLKKLKKAKCLSEHYKVPYSDEIDNEIMKVKKQLWLEEDAKFMDVLHSFKSYAQDLIMGQETEESCTERINQLEAVTNAAMGSKDRTIPSYLCCKISMCIMKDPVISSSGLTYERELLEMHLRSNGEFDPITREPCKLSNLIPNYYIKEAVEFFLDKNPWAYDDYYGS